MWTVALLLPLLPLSNAISCGVGQALCPKSEPCCSTYGVCGATANHCGGGCQGEFSFSANPTTASCYADRANIGRKCVSGLYDFTSTTWIINSDGYDGDSSRADFTVDSFALSNMKLLPGGGVQLLLTPPLDKSPNTPGQGIIISSTAYLMYGKFCAKVKGGLPGGMVTAFISMSDVKDEIDWEWVGKDLYSAQTNYFYRGVIDYTKGFYAKVANNVNQHSYRYCVDWNSDSVTWTIDGNVVRVLTREMTRDANGVYTFPSTPSRIQFSVWDGGAGAAGTRDWAGGYIDWSAVGPTGYYSATFENVMIQCQGDPEPIGPPTRKKSVPAPSVSEAPIKVAVPELSGYSNLTYKAKSEAHSKSFNFFWFITLMGFFAPLLAILT